MGGKKGGERERVSFFFSFYVEFRPAFLSLSLFSLSPSLFSLSLSRNATFENPTAQKPT